MLKKNKYNTECILDEDTISHEILDFPERYIDPRDFHEAILKTSLEAKKIPLPKIAKKHGRIGIGYVSLLGSVLDIWFLVITTQLLLSQGYDGICIISSDYTKSYFEREQIGPEILHTSYASTKQLQIPKKHFFGNRLSEVKLTPEQSYTLYSVQTLFPIRHCVFFNVGTQMPEDYISGSETSKEFLVIDRMMEYIHNQKNFAIIVIGEHEEEMKYDYNASRVFEAIVTTLERTVKKTSFDSALGELTLFFG